MLAERVRWGDSLEDSLLDVIHPASLGFMELNKFRYLVSTSLFSLRSRWCFIYDPSHCTRTRISIKQHIKQAQKSHVQIWMKGARQITPNPAMIRSANPDIVSWQCPNLTAREQATTGYNHQPPYLHFQHTNERPPKGQLVLTGLSAPLRATRLYLPCCPNLPYFLRYLPSLCVHPALPGSTTQPS